MTYVQVNNCLHPSLVLLCIFSVLLSIFNHHQLQLIVLHGALDVIPLLRTCNVSLLTLISIMYTAYPYRSAELDAYLAHIIETVNIWPERFYEYMILM
jgi:hypothetical protein